MTQTPVKHPGGHPHPQPNHYKLWVDNASDKEGNPVDFTVHINGKADHDIKVFYATSNGTAQAGKDYVPEFSYVTIKAGQSSAKIDIKTIEDHKYEPTETFNLKIWEFDKHVDVKDGHGIGTIYDDDKPYYHQPKVSVGDAKAKEGDFPTDGGVLRFKVTVDGPNYDGLAVRWHTEKGDGPFGANNYGDKDYKPVVDTLYIGPGKNHGYIEVKANGDTKKEFDEYFKVVLDDTHYYKVGDGHGLGIILNDDKPDVTPSFAPQSDAMFA